MRISRFTLLLVPALLASGCSSDPAPPDVVRADGDAGAGGSSAGGAGGSSAGGSNTGGTAAGGDAGSGPVDPGGKGNEVDYPAGPYGLEVGSIVSNYKFNGLRDPKEAGYKTTSTEFISFSDYYNPTGDETKPRALVVTASARWCTYCKAEAVNSMKHHAYWNPKGVEFITTLFDNETPGEPATFKDLELWTKAYKLEYPVVLDPNPPKLGVFFKLDAAPFNMVLDLTTMKILFKAEGQVEFDQNDPTLKKAIGG